jgi:ribosomal protein S18 acetylase RimI-like enzyme
MSRMELRLRRAEKEDVMEIVRLSAALFREDAGTRDPRANLNWPREERQEYFAGLVASTGSLCLLAEVGGEVVGYLAGRLKEETTLRPWRAAELESMYVRGGHRSLGVGERLVGGFLGWAELQGAERASVTAYATNGRAIRFYRRVGFRPKRVSLEREISSGCAGDLPQSRSRGLPR